MAVKKRGKKTKAKKVLRSKSKKSPSLPVKVSKTKIVLRDFIMSLLLFVVSSAVYYTVEDVFYQNVAFVSSIVFGFVALAFFIVLMIIYILKATRK